MIKISWIDLDKEGERNYIFYNFELKNYIS